MAGMSAPPNWVKARADCNLELSFKALYDLAKRDVDEANGISSITQNRYSFVIQKEEGSHIPRFSVSRNTDGRPVGKVIFEMQRARLSVYIPSTDGFSVNAEWDDENCNCKLLIDNEPHEPWQIVRKALEPIIFWQ